MADEQQDDNLTVADKSLTAHCKRTEHDAKRSPVSVTAVGPYQFCNPCTRAFLEREYLGREYNNEHVVDHHRSLEDFFLAVEHGCPLCGRTLPRLFEDSEFRAASELDFSNIQIHISAMWKETDISRIVHWETRHEAKGHENSSGDIRINITGWAVDELDNGEYITKKASVPLSNPSQVLSITSSIDIRPWLKNCIKFHSCSKDRSSDYLPPRLLDCSERNLRLVEGSYLCQSHETIQYTTLSHCWGTSAIQLMLDSDNIDQFYTEICYSDLPATFKDAVKITKKLGLSYLWIDSLCIIQKGPRHQTDWEMHVREIADIYSNGCLNIAASWSSNSTGGCFYSRMPGLSRACIANINGTLELYEEWNYGMTNMFHLNSRAWVFQERILSPRVVHYNKNDVFWECKQLSASAKFPRGFPQTRGRGNSEGSIFQFPFWNKTHWEISDSKIDVHVHWLSLVAAYIQCDITRPEDRLPAISAIARRINETYIHERYVAGFFISNLPTGLLWGAGIRQPVYRPDSYVAPSWSWASVQGRIFLVPNQEDDLVNTYAKVKSTSIELIDPKNPYGQVRAGSMLIEGSILRVYGTEQNSGYQNCDLKLPLIELQSRVFIRLIWDTGSPTSEGEECILFCIGERTIDEEYQGLIISPVQHDADASTSLFSRIGVWSLRIDDCGWMSSSSDEGGGGEEEEDDDDHDNDNDNDDDNDDDCKEKEADKEMEAGSKMEKKALEKINMRTRKEQLEKELEQTFIRKLRNYVQNELEEINLV